MSVSPSNKFDAHLNNFRLSSGPVRAAQGFDGLMPHARDKSEILVLARDPRVIAAATDAAIRISGRSPRLVGNVREALAALTRPGLPPRRVMLEPAAAGNSWAELLSTLDDPALTDAMVFVAADQDSVPDGVAVLPAEAAMLEAALLAAPRHARRVPPSSAEALAAGLDRGALLVRYQPVVRVSDRRFVLVEALARWRGSPMLHGPDSFVPAVERAGLSRALAVAVVSRAAQDIGGLPRPSPMGVSVNVSLEQLQRPDLTSWIARALRTGSLAPRALSLELTETTPVRDFALLGRAIRRVGEAGHGVFIDDLGLDDIRLELMDLPFAGVKLDKALVSRLPHDARARRNVQAVVRRANRNGQVVTAEGVSDARLWQTVAGLGVHRAQGFWVGRPLPCSVLPGWARSWAASARE